MSNDIEIFQSFCRRWFNRQVREYFIDIPGEDTDNLSLASPRPVIKRICTHKDEDTLSLTIGRLLVWLLETRGVFEEAIYGIPATQFERTFTYLPQVKLHFKESKYHATNNNRPAIKSVISYRWNSQDFSQANIMSLANQIKNEFATPPYKFNRGREFYTYKDRNTGYYFQLYVPTEAEARKVISKAWGLQQTDPPDFENYLKRHIDNKNYDTEEYINIDGERLRKPRKRPIGLVEFIRAELFINGKTRPITLVDRTGHKPFAKILL